MSNSQDNGTARGGRLPRPQSAGSRPATNPDERLDERVMYERETAEDREQYEDERLEMFLENQHQTVLPKLPQMDGFHLCWLTTSNPNDSIHWRLSIGYELLRVEDCPGWAGTNASVGGIDGCVCVREMVAARIPVSLFNKLTTAMHHLMPLREEEKLRASTSELAREARRRNIGIQEGDGTADIVNRAEQLSPVFTE